MSNFISKKLEEFEEKFGKDIKREIKCPLEDFILIALTEQKEEILRDFKKVENEMDKPAFALLYGMKVKSSYLVPKDEIWIGTDHRLSPKEN